MVNKPKSIKWTGYLARIRKIHTGTNLKERDNLEDLGVDVITGWNGVDSIHVAQDRKKLRAFVKTVTSFRLL